MKEDLIIKNGRLITPYRIIDGGTVVVRDGVIHAVGEEDVSVSDAAVIDAGGLYVAPGFIDLHVHGGGGHDFMDGTEEAFLAIAATHAQYGTTAMLPTTLTSTKEDILRTLEIYAGAHARNERGAQFLGLHLEGPYFAMSQRGAQDPRYIRNPDPEEYREVLERAAMGMPGGEGKDLGGGPRTKGGGSLIRRWSAAPELEGALEFADHARSRGVLVALAHTDAIYEEVLKGYERGYTLATHLYSAMNGVIRRNAFRYAGAVEASFLIDGMDVEIIADGIHLPPALLQLVYKIKGAGRTALITDAMRGAGMPPGESILGNKENGLKVIIEDGVAKLPDRTAFAGSVATADRLVRNMVRMAGVPLTEAVQMITHTPARILGMEERKGALVADMDADLVLFDEDIQIQRTIINGETVYGNG